MKCSLYRYLLHRLQYMRLYCSRQHCVEKCCSKVRHEKMWTFIIITVTTQWSAQIFLSGLKNLKNCIFLSETVNIHIFTFLAKLRPTQVLQECTYSSLEILHLSKFQNHLQSEFRRIIFALHIFILPFYT